MKQIYLILSLIFMTSLCFAQNNDRPTDIKQDMDQAIQELNNVMDTIDIERFFNEGFSQISGGFDKIDMDQLSDMMRMSSKMMENLNIQDFQSKIDSLGMEDQLMKMFEQFDFKQFENIMPPVKEEKKSKTKKI